MIDALKWTTCLLVELGRYSLRWWRLYRDIMCPVEYINMSDRDRLVRLALEDSRADR